jgi:hypothetical protein
MRHDYTQDLAKDNLQALYGQLFNVVAQANVILKHIAEEGNNVGNPATRSVIEGEAYALRALCQMDILRLINRKIVRFISVNMTSFRIIAVQPFSFI